jgi:uncharacterized protein (DUF362 family)
VSVLVARRSVLGGLGAASALAVGGALGCEELLAPRAEAEQGRRPAGAGRVVLARDASAVRALAPDAGRVARMVERAMVALTGAGSAREAWRSLFSPRDRVGIKVNCLAGPGLSSAREVVEPVVRGLEAAGIPLANIVVWDRDSAELERAGYTVNTSSSATYRCYGTDRAGLTEQIHSSGRVGSLLSRILTDRIDALINVPILKDHDLSGVGIGMKNLYGCIHNPNRYHDDNCDPYLADVSSMPAIRSKLRLVLCDALRPQCHGGPALVRQHQWALGGVLASTDPVALDAAGARIIEQQRASRGLQTLAEAGRPPSWLRTAEQRGLGVADLARIRVQEV